MNLTFAPGETLAHPGNREYRAFPDAIQGAVDAII